MMTRFPWFDQQHGWAWAQAIRRVARELGRAARVGCGIGYTRHLANRSGVFPAKEEGRMRWWRHVLDWAGVRPRDRRGADLDRLQDTSKPLDLSQADLRGASLARKNLDQWVFAGAELRDADLHRASLIDADLSRARLREASLQGADLRRARLQGADLRHADLRGADLRTESLVHAVLRHILWDEQTRWPVGFQPPDP